MLTAVGTGATIALAGCSGDSQDGSGNGENEPENTQTETESPTENTESETAESQDTETPAKTSSGDTVHEGEEDFEEWLSSHETDVVLESHWMEFEDPESHFDLPLIEYVVGNTDLSYNIREKSSAALDKFDSLYVAIPEEGAGELQIRPLYFSEEKWDSSMSARENMQELGRLMIGGYAPITENDLEAFFEEDVVGYDDVSEDFPQKYLDLVDQ